MRVIMTPRQLRRPRRSSPDSPKPVWNSLEVAKLLSTLGLALWTAWLVPRYFRAQDELQQRRADVQALSRSIAERRTRAALLYTAILRYSTNRGDGMAAEMKQRKAAYDETYVE